MELCWLLVLTGLGTSGGDIVPLTLTPGKIENIDVNLPLVDNSTQRIWQIVTDMGYSIILNCPYVYVGKGMAGDCFGYLLLRDSQGMATRICDSYENYYYRTDGPSLDLLMNAGPYKTFLNCEIEARETIQVGPQPTVKPIFSEESSEEDSSEHGGPSGKKMTSCECGWANKETKRVVGGKITEVNEFPFMVAFVLHNASKTEQFCGGTIITPRHVLTAGHCMGVYNVTDTYVIIGAHHVDQSLDPGARQTFRIQNIYKHENYIQTEELLRNDIALVQLNNEIIFNTFIGPACVSPIHLDLNKKYVKNIGWGQTAHNRPNSKILQKVNLRVVPFDKCTEYQEIDNTTQICTYGVSKSTCMGDSGGPIVWVDPETNRYTLVGIVSYGNICGMFHPDVHTNVTAFYSWIHSKIKANFPELQMCSKIG